MDLPGFDTISVRKHPGFAQSCPSTLRHTSHYSHSSHPSFASSRSHAKTLGLQPVIGNWSVQYASLPSAFERRHSKLLRWQRTPHPSMVPPPNPQSAIASLAQNRFVCPSRFANFARSARKQKTPKTAPPPPPSTLNPQRFTACPTPRPPPQLSTLIHPHSPSASTKPTRRPMECAGRAVAATALFREPPTRQPPSPSPAPPATEN
ncbi:MAG: hypothetical protein JWR69_4340 [Pedosphaera sp.]|nr:hypothetical protein [Pedosphaera sp.]